MRTITTYRESGRLFILRVIGIYQHPFTKMLLLPNIAVIEALVAKAAE
jgi:hypothetical protein